MRCSGQKGVKQLCHVCLRGSPDRQPYVEARSQQVPLPVVMGGHEERQPFLVDCSWWSAVMELGL